MMEKIFGKMDGNSPQNNHLDDEYLYELWVLECQM
jgi:hypothetical protein